jgi:hypothetical protein
MPLTRILAPLLRLGSYAAANHLKWIGKCSVHCPSRHQCGFCIRG